MTTGVTGLFDSPQWRIADITVINWGGYDGLHCVEFGTGSTMITGESGVGKSTLMDAYTALIMPSSVKFNAASNTAQGRARGESQRNLISYVRGKTDRVQKAGQEAVDRTLRGISAGKPCSIAATIAVRFRRDDGALFMALRLIYIRPSDSSDAQTHTTYATISSDLDIEKVYEVFSRQPGQRQLLKATFPGLDTYDTHTAFATALQKNLQLGKPGEIDRALTLLSRIQEGRQASSIDGLYKELVFERPLAYEAADKAVASYQETSAAHDRMKVTRAQIDVLADVEERYGDYEQARAAGELIAGLRHTEPTDTPWQLWRSQVSVEQYSAAVDDHQDRLDDAVVELGVAEEAVGAAKSVVDARRTALWDEGGQRVVQIAEEIGQHQQALAARKRTAALFELKLGMVGDLPMPETVGDLSSLQATAASFAAGADAELRRRQTAASQAAAVASGLTEEVRARSTELDDLRSRPDSLIDGQLHARRVALAQACGVSDPRRDMPFVGELIDMLADDERWRLAAEAAIGGFARHLLVDESLRQQFVRNADQLKRGQRIRSESVPLNAPDSGRRPDPSTLAGKLRFKSESPYTGWLREHLARRFDHLCVEHPDDLLINDGRQRITVNGQTRQGRSGAHGAPRQDQFVLGFSNQERIASLQEQLEQKTQELQDAQAASDQAFAALNDFNNHRSAWADIAAATWDSLDVKTPVAAIEALEYERKVLQGATNTLAQLESALFEAEALFKQATQAEARKALIVERLEDDLARLHPALERSTNHYRRLHGRGDIEVSDAQAAYLTRLLGEYYTGNVDGLDDSLAKVSQKLTTSRAEQAKAEQSARSRTEDVFKLFLSRWPNDEWGTDIVSYPNYRDHFQQLVNSDIARHEETFRDEVSKWTGTGLALLAHQYDADRRIILDRLHDVNAILANIPFGRDDDRVRIDSDDVPSLESRNFWGELQRFSDDTAERGAASSVDVAEGRYASIVEFTERIMPKDLLPEGRTSRRDEILDVRRHIRIRAQKVAADDPDNVKGTYAEFDSKSGGEMQEMVAFVVGAALRYQLGDDESRSKPTFAPVVLDEAFIKADSQFASRAVQAWIDLGFQIIAGSVTDKASALSRKVDRVIVINKDRDGYSYAGPFLGDEEVPA